MDKRDQQIKDIFQKDKLISKKADDIFNNFLKEENNMKENDVNQTQNQEKVRKFAAQKKAVATAACLAVVAGGAQIYASTQGYGNVFFLVKYLITGEKTVVNDKDAILTDKDITISYEPIQLTENVKLQVRRLKIQDNKAVLTVATYEDEDGEEPISPLNFKVTAEDGTILCEQDSKADVITGDYERFERWTNDELELKGFRESDKKIKLEVFSNNGKSLIKLEVDLESRTVTVEGQEEALKKISEIEVKEFLGRLMPLAEKTFAAGDYTETGLAELKINYAVSVLVSRIYDGDNSKVVFDLPGYENSAFKKSEINGFLKDMGIEEVEDRDLNRSNLLEVIKYDNEEYFMVKAGYDGEYAPYTCFDISNMSYNNGVYTATFTYTNMPEQSTFNSDMDIFETTLSFTVNDEGNYSKFKFIRIYDLQRISNVVKEENNEQPEVVSPTPAPTATPIPSDSIGELNSGNKVNADWENSAMSLSWREYWAPGLKLQYPENFNITEYSTYSEVVTNRFEKAVELNGAISGIAYNGEDRRHASMKITVYKPEYVIAENQEEYTRDVAYSMVPGFSGFVGAGLTTTRGDFWNMTNSENNGTRYDLITIYFTDINVGLKVLVETTGEIDTNKINNMIDWITGSLKTTSV